MVFAIEKRSAAPLRLLARFGLVEARNSDNTASSNTSLPHHRHHSGSTTLTTNERPRENDLATAKTESSCKTKVQKDTIGAFQQSEKGSVHKKNPTKYSYSDDATWDTNVAAAKKQLSLTMANVPTSHKAWEVEKNQLVPADMIATAMGDILVERIRILDPKLFHDIPMEGWEEILAAPVPVMEKILLQMEECEEQGTPFGWGEIKQMVHLQSLRESFRETNEALLTAGSTYL